MFLHILPAPLYTVAIALAASLSLFKQKEFLIARPAIIAQKI
jgi:hypothetical protein